MNQKPNLLLGFHNHISSELQKSTFENELTKNHIDFLHGLTSLLNKFQRIKTTVHLSGSLISYLDKQFADFSSSIRSLLDRNQLELLSGGLYEPIFSFIPKEDRQTQLLLMNRLINHTYGYTPLGAWITELSWEPSFALDLAKSRILYTCLPKEYFIHAGLQENEISGYYLTEEEGRKVAVFPISYELNTLIKELSPEEAVKKLLDDSNINPTIALFYRGEDADINKLNWLKGFFELLYNHSDQIETALFSEYFTNNKPKGRIYLPTLQSTNLQNTAGHWKNLL